MVTVSSAFISSRRERISFRVLSASGCAFKAAAWVDVLHADLGKTDLDNTDVARDHFLSLYRGRRILERPLPFYACGVNGFNIQYPQHALLPKFCCLFPAIRHELRKMRGRR